MSNNYQPLRPTKLRQKVSSAARRWARDLRRWSWSPWPSPEGAPSSAAACPCPTEPGEDGKIGRRNVTCILWHVYEMYDVFDMYWNVDSWPLALLSYPKIVEEFCGFRWQYKASRCPFLVVDHPCIQATLRLWSVSSVLWDGTPCMWSTARSQSAGEVRINHPKLC